MDVKSASNCDGSSALTSGKTEAAPNDGNNDEDVAATSAIGVTNAAAAKRPERIRLHEINPYLTCHLCHGYLIDATTISECLHSFCRSCIIKFLQENSYCPVCEVIVNKAKPNIKLDKTLQDIVYKIVPELFVKEMRRRQLFYRSRPHLAAKMTPEARGEDTERIVYNPRDSISLSLERVNDDTGAAVQSAIDPPDAINSKRFLQCPGMCRVEVLKKFVMTKYNVDPGKYHIDILYKRVPLPDHYTMIDVAYIYSWKRNEPLKFFYRITDLDHVTDRFDYIPPTQPSPTPAIDRKQSHVLASADDGKRAAPKRKDANRARKDKKKSKKRADAPDEDKVSTITDCCDVTVQSASEEERASDALRDSSVVVLSRLRDADDAADEVAKREDKVSPKEDKSKVYDFEEEPVIKREPLQTIEERLTIGRRKRRDEIAANRVAPIDEHRVKAETNDATFKAETNEADVKAETNEADVKLEASEPIEPIVKAESNVSLAENDEAKSSFLKNMDLTPKSSIGCSPDASSSSPSPSSSSSAAAAQKRKAPSPSDRAAKKPRKSPSKRSPQRQQSHRANGDRADLQLLFDNCAINIPSSLSITIKEKRNGDADGDKRYQPYHGSIGPVQNYIEILKLPDAQSANNNNNNGAMESAKKDLDGKRFQQQQQQHHIPCNVMPMKENCQHKKPLVTQQTLPPSSRSPKTFQKMFEESIKKTTTTTAPTTTLPPQIAEAKCQRGALDLTTANLPPNGIGNNNNGNKKNILEIAYDLYKRSNLPERALKKRPNNAHATVVERYVGKVPIPRLRPQAATAKATPVGAKSPAVARQLSPPSQLKFAQTVANLHSATLGMNYTVSVQQSHRRHQATAASHHHRQKIPVVTMTAAIQQQQQAASAANCGSNATLTATIQSQPRQQASATANNNNGAIKIGGGGGGGEKSINFP